MFFPQKKGLDRTDLMLCRLLQTNSRVPYHDLAQKLGLSINAVHKRIRELVAMGIIRSFRARVSLFGLDALNVWVFGRSSSAHLDEVHLRLLKNDCTYWVARSGGEYLYVGAYLRDISQLEPYTSFATHAAEITSPTVGIFPSMPRRPAQSALHALDYKIVSSLQHDSRKSLSDVAAEVGASAKTVRRRLSWMTDRQLIELTIDWYPDASNDVIAISHITTSAGSDKMKLMSAVTEKFEPNAMFCLPFSNLPNQLVAFLWTNTMKQMEELRSRIGRTDGVESVAANVLQIGYIFDTWRDRIPAEQLKAA